MPDVMPTPRALPASTYLGRCKGCGHCVRLVAPLHVGSRLFANGYHGDLFQAGTLYGFGHHGGPPQWFDCPCGKLGKLVFVRGKFNPAKVCNARCLASHSGVCECSCGGKNHGASYSA